MLAQYTFAFSNRIDQIDMQKSFTIGFLNSDNFADLIASQNYTIKKICSKIEDNEKTRIDIVSKCDD